MLTHREKRAFRYVRTLAVALVALVMVALSACGQAKESTPLPAKDFVCIKDREIEAGPCPQYQWERQQKEAAELAEAEAVYRKFLAEDIRRRRGGNQDTSLSEIYLETTTGEFQQDVAKSILIGRKNGSVMTGPDPITSPIERVWDLQYDDSDMAIRVCEDWSVATFTYSEGSSLPGSTVIVTLYLVRVDGRLAFNHEDGEETDSCDSF